MSINRNWRGTKTERNETIAKEGSRQAASSSSTPGLETELARGPLRRARETPVDDPLNVPSPPRRFVVTLFSAQPPSVSLPLRLPCILGSRRPRSHPSRHECVFLLSVPLRASPSSRAGHFGVGREQGGGRWTRYITTDVCVVPVAQQWNRPYTAVLSPPLLPFFPFFPPSSRSLVRPSFSARGCNPYRYSAALGRFPRRSD